jgi:hypothetical protein
MSERVVAQIVWDDEEKMSFINWNAEELPMASTDVADQQFVVDVVYGVIQDIALMEAVVRSLVYAEFKGYMH